MALAESAPSALLKAALRYCRAQSRLSLADKRPSVGDRWQHWQATRESVIAHYAEHPDDEVGIRCGNGLVGLDVDYWDGGREALDALEREHGELPATPTVITGSESRHYHFRGYCASRNLRCIGIDGMRSRRLRARSSSRRRASIPIRAASTAGTLRTR